MKLFAMFMASIALLTAGEQKVVLITGCSKGIGRATAEAFVKKGWSVWASSRREQRDPLEGTNNIILDVNKQSTIDLAIKKIMETEGRIDAVVNNAGYGLVGTEESVTIGQAKRLFDTNFFGPLRIIQSIAPIMRAQKSGHIINISSTSGIRPVATLGLYAATKHALEAISESLAVHLSPWNIQVSLIEPGLVKNRFIQGMEMGSRKTDTDFGERLSQRFLAKYASLLEGGQPVSEIADLIVSVAENPKPNLRYQTSEKVKETVDKKYADPTGNDAVASQKEFMDMLLTR